MKTKGYTLAELLVALFLSGILLAIAIPSFVGVIEWAQYGYAIREMSRVMRYVEIYHAEHDNRYPLDVDRNARPEGIPQFPIRGEDYIPFRSFYDYDLHSDGSQCFVQIVFAGKDRSRHFPTYRLPGLVGEVFEVGDDRILLVDVYPCDHGRGRID